MAQRGRVMIGKRGFDTEKDKDGRTFIKGNRIVRRFLDRCQRGAKYNLNDLAEDYAGGLFTQDEMLEFYGLIGYSICGIAELSYFADLPINEVVKPRK